MWDMNGDIYPMVSSCRAEEQVSHTTPFKRVLHLCQLVVEQRDDYNRIRDCHINRCDLDHSSDCRCDRNWEQPRAVDNNLYASSGVRCVLCRGQIRG